MQLMCISRIGCTIFQSIKSASWTESVKLIYGQKLLEGRESRERMIEEHQSYLDALKQRDSERISHLLAQNLKKRTENIPYSLDVYFHENA